MNKKKNVKIINTSTPAGASIDVTWVVNPISGKRLKSTLYVDCTGQLSQTDPIPNDILDELARLLED